ncbi:MAG: DUF4390 domain-containing protein [Deltaproteobacteria bacterium]|nr:DUF4390 domain-containing protein [Deltaproteobacteria bacterium]
MKKAIIGILTVLLLQITTDVSAQTAYLSDIVVTNTRDHLLLYFTVNGCFTPEMNAAIDSGIETTFTFFVKLYEKRRLLWNRELADLVLYHHIKYDNLKGTYEIRLSEENGKKATVNNFAQAKKLMADVVALKVAPMDKMTKGKSYQVQMKAQLDEIKLPFYLHHVLFFLSLWNFATDWYAVDFKY